MSFLRLHKNMQRSLRSDETGGGYGEFDRFRQRGNNRAYDYSGRNMVALELINQGNMTMAISKYDLLLKRYANQLNCLEACKKGPDGFLKLAYETAGNMEFERCSCKEGWDFLATAVESGKWSQNNIAILIFDAGRKIGIELSVVALMDRLLVKSGDFVLDCENGKITGFSNDFMFSYPSSYSLIEDGTGLNYVAHLRHAERHYQKREYWEMAECCSTAIGNNAGSSHAYYMRGKANMRIGEGSNDAEAYERALADFEKAVAICPFYPNAYNCASLIHEKNGRYKEAMKAVKNAIVLEPDNPAYRHNKGKYHYHMCRLLLQRDNIDRPAHSAGSDSMDALRHKQEGLAELSLAREMNCDATSDLYANSLLLMARLKMMFSPADAIPDLAELLEIRGIKKAYEKKAMDLLQRIRESGLGL